MAVKGPKHGVPTPRGWIHEKTGELLKAQRISEDQILEWEHQVHEKHHGAPAAPQTLHEAPAVEREITQAEAEWHHGVSHHVEEEHHDEEHHGHEDW